MKRQKKTDIAVIEGQWWPNKNISARGLFDLVSEINCENRHAYHYEMANSEPAIKEAIPRISRLRGVKYLCIATHGDENGLCLLDNQRLRRVELRNI